MPPRIPARIRIEATTAPGVREVRQVVYLYVDGFRFELEAPYGPRARQIALALALALGLEDIDG
jgi:hypothetical protein